MNERWQIILGDTGRREMSRVVKADDPEFIIAYVIREWANKRQQAEDDARGNLLAAAPDLVEALELVCDSGCPLANVITEKMLAAIRKAKGE